MKLILRKLLIWDKLCAQWGGLFPVWDTCGGSRILLCFQRFAILVFVVLGVVFPRAGELFEEVGVLDRAGDFIVSAGPFAEIDAAAAVGAEREVFAAGEDDGPAGGTAQRFRFR